MNQIINFFNTNKLIAVLALIIMVLITWHFYSKIYKFSAIENFSGANGEEKITSLQCSPCKLCPLCPSDSKFDNLYVGRAKILNFKCTYDSKEYYLACVKVNSCSSEENQISDCNNTAIILINKEDIESSLSDYMNSLSDNEAICNLKKKLACEKIPNPNNLSEEEIIKQCDVKYFDCIQKRMFIHDFVVTEATTTVSSNKNTNNGDDNIRKKYLISGTAEPLLNGKSFATLLNQHLYNKLSQNLICGDNFLYGSDSNDNLNVEISIIEYNNSQNSDNIIGGLGPPIKILIKFNTQDSVVVVDNVGKKIVTPLYDKPNVPKIKSTYLGISKDKTCQYNGKSYQRACLYDILDGNNEVLYFEPIIVI